MPGHASNAAKLAIGGAAVPLLAMSAVLMLLAGGGANAAPTSTVCGGGGTVQTIGTVTLDGEQMGNAHTIVSVVAARHLPVYAADVAVTAAYTKSGLHNSTTESDHDSEGLFRQRISIYTGLDVANCSARLFDTGEHLALHDQASRFHHVFVDRADYRSCIGCGDPVSADQNARVQVPSSDRMTRSRCGSRLETCRVGPCAPSWNLSPISR